MTLEAADRPRYDLNAASESFIFEPPITADERITFYRQLTDGFRTLDEEGGGLFRRLFDQADVILLELARKLKRAQWVQDPAFSPDVLLPLILANVGFDNGDATLRDLRRRMDKPTMRRLVRYAAKFWKTRGGAAALVASANFTSGFRPVYLDLAQLAPRVGSIYVGGTQLPGEHLGVLNLDENDAESDLYRVHLLVSTTMVTLDKSILEDFCELSRALGERIKIHYLDFVDDFLDGLNGYWSLTGHVQVAPSDPEATPPLLAGLRFSGAGEAVLAVNGSDAWTEYTFGFVARFESDSLLDIFFYRQSEDDSYFVRTNADGSYVGIFKIEGGVTSQIYPGTALPSYSGTSSFSISSAAPAILDVEISVSRPGTDNAYRVAFGGVVVVDEELDNTHSAGSIGFAADSSAVVVQRVYLYQRSTYSYTELAP